MKVLKLFRVHVLRKSHTPSGGIHFGGPAHEMHTYDVWATHAEFHNNGLAMFFNNEAFVRAFAPGCWHNIEVVGEQDGQSLTS